MSALQVKEQLHRYIDLADSRMAEALLAMFKNYFQSRNGDVVAYTTKGQPLNKEQIIEEVMGAVEDVEKGNYYTTDEVKKAIKKQ